MGLFDFITGKKTGGEPSKTNPREIARLRKLVSDKLAQDFDRQEAIAQLTKIGTGEAAEALLRRFSWSMDPSITDQDEKQAALEGIVAVGEPALEPLREYCLRAESITWPLKILRRIVDEERFVEELLGLLDEYDTEYMRNPEPKLQLLRTLEGYPSPEVREAVEPFLVDAAEPVRFAAVTTIFAMKDPAAVGALTEAMADEESLRVRNRIAQGLESAGWVVPEDQREVIADVLPPEFRLTASGTLSR